MLWIRILGTILLGIGTITSIFTTISNNEINGYGPVVTGIGMIICLCVKAFLIVALWVL